MEHAPGEQPPLDERSVLDDLEHLHEQIEQSKAHRAELQEQFDAFLQRFDPPELPADVETPVQRHQAIAPAAASSKLAPADSAPEPAPAASVQPVTLARAPEAQPAARDRTKGPFRGSRLLVGGVALLLAGGAATWAVRSRTPVTEPAPSHSRIPEPAPAPPLPLSPEPVPRTESVVTTERAVWLRVLVDGERVLEREVPAGTRLPFDPRESIVIRTGDAGAVRLSIRGSDQGLLGREGEVVTRTFTLTPTAER